MRGDKVLYELLSLLKIDFEYYEHPPVPTVQEASKYWKDIDSTHCKNLFFRNHKGNKHYLVILEHSKDLSIKELELKLKQGKISFASEERMYKFLKITPGSVSPFGLIYDSEHHVHLFIDINLKNAKKLSFHPNLNTASLVITNENFIKYLNHIGNSYEFVSLYD